MSAPADVQRAERLARRLAERSTPTFAERGDALRAALAAERDADRARAALANDEAWERIMRAQSPESIERHVRAFDHMLADVCADTGVDDESAALDVLDSYLTLHVLDGRPRASKIAVALELLRTTFAFDVATGLDHLRRLIG